MDKTDTGTVSRPKKTTSILWERFYSSDTLL